MHDLRRLISSANLLYTFEAAARHESFTLAARELNVTPAAVSHGAQIDPKFGPALQAAKVPTAGALPGSATLNWAMTSADTRPLTVATT